jgi:hypothetical protein
LFCPAWLAGLICTNTLLQEGADTDDEDGMMEERKLQ